MAEVEEQLKPEEQIINRVRKIVEENPERVRMGNSEVAGFDVGLSGLSPIDPEIALRLLGPMEKMRLILSKRDDNSIQIQAHATYLSKEIQVITLELPPKGPQSFSEYKVVYNPQGQELTTTPVPIPAGIREETILTFGDLLNRVKS